MLELQDITIKYGGIAAVREVSLNVKNSEIVSIIGPNGAGKTTVLMAISGIVPKYSGAIVFQGDNITRKPSHKIVKSGIIHVPEGRMIFSGMTVHENILMGGHYQKYGRGEFDDQVEMITTQFPILKDRWQQNAGSLSGGEQQMLSIARGLIAKPKLLMLDEPSLGLAPLVISHIFVALKNLNISGLTILLVEQNAKKALTFSKRAYVIESGSLAFQDTSSNLLANENIKKAYLGG